jgi:hypothetical protein
MRSKRSASRASGSTWRTYPGDLVSKDRLGVRSERLAQLRDVVANLAGGGCRRRAVVERVDELLDRYDLAGAQEQDGEDAPRFRTAEANWPPAGNHLERAQDAKLHTHSCRP